MIAESIVYILRPPLVDYDRYNGLEVVPDRSRPTSVINDFESTRQLSKSKRFIDDVWQPPSLRHSWEPIRVRGSAVWAEHDMPWISAQVPVFSQRAVNALGEMLANNGELLPLLSDLGEYWAFNVTTIVDSLDRDRTRFAGPGQIKIHSFVREKLVDRTLFKIPQSPSTIYVTEEFANRSRVSALVGLDLIKVWPLPEGQLWWDYARQDQEARLIEWEKRSQLR